MPLLLYDSTATASTNLIPNEIHAVDLNPGSVIIAEQGLFYAHTLKAKSMPSNTPLRQGVDFILVGFSPTVTKKSTLEVYAGLRLINRTLTGFIHLEYQAVGGNEGDSRGLIYQLIDQLAHPPEQITYDDIKGYPLYNNPSHHLHSLVDLDGVTAIIYYAREIVEAIIGRRAPVMSGQNLSNRINNLNNVVSKLAGRLDSVLAALLGLEAGTLAVIAGPKGDKGDPGVKGDKGDPGDPGTNEVVIPPTYVVLNVENVGVVPRLVGSMLLPPGTYAPKAKVGCPNTAYIGNMLINNGPNTISTTGSGNVSEPTGVVWRTCSSFTLNNETDVDFYLVADSVSATSRLQGIKI